MLGAVWRSVFALMSAATAPRRRRTPTAHLYPQHTFMLDRHSRALVSASGENKTRSARPRSSHCSRCNSRPPRRAARRSPSEHTASVTTTVESRPASFLLRVVRLHAPWAPRACVLFIRGASCEQGCIVLVLGLGRCAFIKFSHLWQKKTQKNVLSWGLGDVSLSSTVP